jgi:hypothetical protein
MAKTSILQVYCRHKRVTNVICTSDNVIVKFGHYVGSPTENGGEVGWNTTNGSRGQA